MSKVTTFSRFFPAYHPRKGEPTYFVEAILTQLKVEYKTGNYYKWLIENNPEISEVFLMKFFDSLKRDIDPKSNTIRNHKRPLKAGEFINPKCWAGKPYHKTIEGFWQIKFAPDLEIKKTWQTEIVGRAINGKVAGIGAILIEGKLLFDWHGLAKNDGLQLSDFENWFSKLPFKGYVICWNENINY